MTQHHSSKNLIDSEYRDQPLGLQSKDTLARDQYSSLMKKALQSDDDQEFFTSAGAHYVRGSELTTRIALLAASRLEKGML
jgi:hypothetical protein